MSAFIGPNQNRRIEDDFHECGRLTWARASDGRGRNLLGLLCGAGPATGIHFGEIFSQIRCLFVPQLSGENWLFDNAEADRLIFQYAPPEQAFYDCFLAGRLVFGIADQCAFNSCANGCNLITLRPIGVNFSSVDVFADM